MNQQDIKMSKGKLILAVHLHTIKNKVVTGMCVAVTLNKLL